MAVVRFEVWSRPDSGTFTRKFPLKDITDWSLETGIFGRGSITLPSDSPNLDDIIFIDPTDHANDKASLIRAYIGTDHLYDFYASRASIVYGETGAKTATINGGGAGASLERTKVRQFDYPDETPSVEPDWRYGFGPELLTNGDFETDPEGIENAGAENENTLGWYTTGDSVSNVGVPNSFEAIEGASGAHSGNWYFTFNGDPYEGVITAFRTIEDEDYPVSVWIKAATGKAYRMSVDGAKAAVVGTMFSNSVYVDGVGTGAYQDVGLTFTADSGGEGRLHITSMETALDVDFDDVTISGFGAGVEPWEIRGNFTAFEISSIYAHSGTYSLKWRPSSGIAGNDSVYQSVQVVENSRIHASMWVYHTEGSNKLFRLVIRKPGVDPNVSNIASVQQSIPTATWTQITATGFSSMPTVEVEMRWDETGAPTNNLFTDDFLTYQGRDEAPAGEILTDLLTAMAGDTNRDALAWLTPTFSATLDSNGVAWDQTIAMVVKRGQSMRRVCDVLMSDFAYEMRIRPNPADHTVIWFDVYNPDGMGTDYTLTDGGAILGAGMVSFGPIVRREPVATYSMIEGEGQWYGEALNLTTQGVWGDIEHYEGTEELLVGTLQEIAGRVTVDPESELVTVNFQASPLTPGIDYVRGDIVKLTLGDDYLVSGLYRVIDVSGTSSDTADAMFQVQFASEGI